MYGPSFGRDLEAILTIVFVFAVLGLVLTPIFVCMGCYKICSNYKVVKRT
jgi:hypothetical protein